MVHRVDDQASQHRGIHVPDHLVVLGRLFAVLDVDVAWLPTSGPPGAHDASLGVSLPVGRLGMDEVQLAAVKLRSRAIPVASMAALHVSAMVAIRFNASTESAASTETVNSRS